jgi:imidazolonepropionase-like amidohydrolase
MPTTQSRPRTLLALRPDALFDGTGARPLARPTVVVDGGLILDVARGAVDLPEGATVVEFPGCTLLPGLVDPHVHLGFDAGPDAVAALAGRDDEAALAGMAEAARRALRAGITTVRDLGDRNYLALELRARAGTGAGLPTILGSGPPLTTAAGHCHFLGGAVPADPASVRAAVAEHAERGVDVIKVMASGGFMTPGSAVERPQFGPAELRTAVEAAHAHGLAITAHAHSTAAIAVAVDAGVDGIEHCSFLTAEGVDAPDDLIARLAHRRVVVGATLGVLPGSVLPPFLAPLVEAMLATLARLHAAGVPIVAATDAGVGPPKPHDVLPHAAVQLAAIGFTPAEALRAMTADAARVCGIGGRTGRIAPGYDADLLAVRGDPLADLDALHRVAAVYHQGRAVDLGAGEGR